MRNYTLQGRGAGAAAWLTLVRGASIGHKRIVVLSPPLKLSEVRLSIVSAVGTAHIRSVAAFAAAACAVPPSPAHAPCEREDDYAFKGAVLKTVQRQVCTAAQPIAYSRDLLVNCRRFYIPRNWPLEVR